MNDSVVDIGVVSTHDKLLGMRQHNAITYLQKRIAEAIDCDTLGFRYPPSLMPAIKEWLDYNGFKYQMIDAGDTIAVELA